MIQPPVVHPLMQEKYFIPPRQQHTPEIREVRKRCYPYTVHNLAHHKEDLKSDYNNLLKSKVERGLNTKSASPENESKKSAYPDTNKSLLHEMYTSIAKTQHKKNKTKTVSPLRELLYKKRQTCEA